MADEKDIEKEIEALKKLSEFYRHIIEEEIKKRTAEGKSLDQAKQETVKFARGITEASKSYRKSSDDITKSIDGLRKNFNKGQKSAEDLNEELMVLRKEINNTADQSKKSGLIQQKADLERANAQNKATDLFKNSLGELSGTVIKGVTTSFTSAAKQALQGGDGFQVAATFMTAQIDMANQASQVGSKALQDFGSATAGAGGKLGAVGVIAGVAGAALGFLSTQAMLN